ncbi:MAG TPA: peptide chain release factor N(5)-glutamine methyltransferase [bacterium]|nr:peptide chain release factor N(5)-glutamine methyltransferase [bacterium]
MKPYEFVKLYAAQTGKGKKGKSSRAAEAVQLLMFRLKTTREKLYTRYREEMPVPAEKRLREDLNLRLKGAPLRYITGEEWFFGREFAVKKGVLIPRQDTEALIRAAKRALAGEKNVTAADMGCGSGIIGITLVLELPQITRFDCCDINNAALALTKQNARRLGAAKRIRVFKGDMARRSAVQRPKYGLIISNPPYVSRASYSKLQREVLQEPKNALFAPEKGFYYYRMLAVNSRFWLKQGGIVIVEAGSGMAAGIKRIFAKSGYRHIFSEHDAGGRERAVVFKVKDSGFEVIM